MTIGRCRGAAITALSLVIKTLLSGPPADRRIARVLLFFIADAFVVFLCIGTSLDRKPGEIDSGVETQFLPILSKARIRICFIQTSCGLANLILVSKTAG